MSAPKHEFVRLTDERLYRANVEHNGRWVYLSDVLRLTVVWDGDWTARPVPDFRVRDRHVDRISADLERRSAA